MDTEKGGRTAIITGGNAGLGYECAKAISSSDPGWHVVLAVRSPEKGERAAREISEETGNPRVGAMALDLASLASVRSFAGALAARDDLPPVKAVVCNAGLQVVSGTTYTEDGFETTFGVNHLGHYLLVNLLLKELAAPARVVFVSSGVHDPKQRTGMPNPRYRGAEALAHPDEHLDPAERGEDPATVGRRRYATSKLCNVYDAYELDRRLRAEGSSAPGRLVTANAFDPGLMPGSGLARDYGPLQRFVWKSIMPVLRVVIRNVNSTARSGRALARLVVDPKLEGVSGRYFEGEKEIRSSDLSCDGKNARELWETSARLVGLRGEETPLRVAAHTPGA